MDDIQVFWHFCILEYICSKEHEAKKALFWLQNHIQNRHPECLKIILVYVLLFLDAFALLVHPK